MGTAEVTLPAVYNLSDRWVAVDPSCEGDFGCEVEYTVSEHGVVTILDIRYTDTKGYINDS